MRGKYATKTGVSIYQTETDIKRVLLKYGANEVMTLSSKKGAGFAFSFENRQIRIMLSLPDCKDDEFKFTPTGREKGENAQMIAWEQACRSRYRALYMNIKMKLEAVETGIKTLEQEFYADLVLPNGQTVAEHTMEQIIQAIDTKKMPPLALGFDGLEDMENNIKEGKRK